MPVQAGSAGEAIRASWSSWRCNRVPVTHFLKTQNLDVSVTHSVQNHTISTVAANRLGVRYGLQTTICCPIKSLLLLGHCVALYTGLVWKAFSQEAPWFSETLAVSWVLWPYRLAYGLGLQPEPK